MTPLVAENDFCNRPGWQLNSMHFFMEESKGLYQQYVSAMQKIADVRYGSAVLQWDQETYLPPAGAAARSRQLATLNEIAHEQFTSPAFGELLRRLNSEGSLNDVERKNVALTQEDYSRQQKFTGSFVRNMSEAVSAAFYSWVDARKANDFKIYLPALQRLVQLKKEEADILGYKDHPYSALVDQYEKGATVEMLDAVFGKVLEPLKALMAEISRQLQPDTSFLHRHFPKQQQWEWGMYLVQALGFDLNAGRQDISEHPFTTNFSAKDVRITTRIDEHDLGNMTWSCIHETGHALYEQGLPDDQYGLPSGEYASLSIHESQSRLWENCVGRSRSFWTYFLPKLAERFPEQLNDVTLDHFMAAINKVAPSLIRTEADEVTYHFHVYIRYLIEKELIGGSLEAKQVPERWNELYQQVLGVTVPDDRRGCLQDVHWSHGSFGYFPTYSLGSFYAAQFWHQCRQDNPGIESELAAGHTVAVLNWLRKNIYPYGRQFTSEQLCERVTGKTLDSNLFVEYLRNKFCH